MDKWATWAEIHAQPDIWRAWGQTFDPQPVHDWIAGLDIDQIWLTGAGTSAFIGDIIAAGLEGRAGPIIRSVPSTDIVSRPSQYLQSGRMLVVSFGRSGDSTETIGVLDALDALAPAAPRLNITCNSKGALARRKSTGGAQRAIILPRETHDKGFAMTSSFSTMLLTALSVLDRPVGFAHRMSDLATELSALLSREPFAAKRPKRAVFLGTGPMAYAAREAALKVMELTAGETAALWDSTLGFRHGPKSFVQDETDIFVLTCNDAHAHGYERDLIDELRHQYPGSGITTIGAGQDIAFDMPDGPVWAAPLAIAVAQVLGARWSADMGLNVDDPFAGRGTLTRVVSGVQLYPVHP